jgi:hypothetical protein
MFTRVCLIVALLSALPAWAQANKSGTGADANNADRLPITEQSEVVDETMAFSHAPMLIPPWLNFEPYPQAVLSETRSDYLRNYLRIGWTMTTGYSDNVSAGAETTKPVSDISYSVWPSIALDRTTSRMHWMLNYRPGFSFYQRTGDLNNQQDQSLALDFQYRLTPHLTATLRDSLARTSNALNQPDLLSGETSGVAQPIIIIAPVATQLTNTANAELTYNFAQDSIAGAEGTFTNLHFPNPAQVPGLYEFSSQRGSAFYSRRFYGKHYIGVTYQYSEYLAYPANPQSDTQTHTALLFYTFYATPTLSLSFSGGPQHFDVEESSSPSLHSWIPAATASIDWRGRSTLFQASYLRMVAGVEGLFGAFNSNTANVLTRWQLARTWNLGASGGYAINKNVASSLLLASPGGHSISGTVSLQHFLTQHIRFELGYTHQHQSYNDIPLISIAPSTNREFATVTYQVARPL